MKRIIFSAACLLFSCTSLFSCNKAGPVEKAGERIDEAADNIKEGESPLKKKGTAEKLGESIDDTFNPDSND